MADRGLTAAAITALSAARTEFYHFVSIGFSTPLYYTTAPFDIFYDGNTYLSNSTLVKLPDIKESLKISPNSISISLNGANASIIPILLSEGKNAEVKIFRRIEDASGAVIQIFQGYTDEFSIKEDSQAGTVDVSLKIANHWADWESVNGRFLSDSYQQALFAGDLGLEFIPLVEFFTNIWGKSFINERVLYDQSWTAYNPYVIGSDDPLWNIYDYFQPAITGHLESVDTVAKKLPVVYGQHTLPGIPVFRTVVDSDLTSINDAMWVVYAIAEGECDSLVDITFGDTSYTSAPYNTSVTAYFVAGTDTQAALTQLVTESAIWTTNHRLRGICYVAIRYVYDKDIWTEDPKPLFTIKGKKVYDPRDTLTKYSTNPALVLNDYLTSSVYGKGLAAALVGQTKLIAAANYADTLKTDHDGGEGGTPVNITLMDFTGIVNTYDSLKKNVERMLFCLRAYLPWINGIYQIVQETEADTGTYVFNEDTIAGSITVKEGSIKTLANEVTYNFIDVAQANARTAVTVKSATYLTADNNRVLRKTITNSNETNRYRAENRANTELKRTRENITIELSAANAVAIRIETGDIVLVTRSVYGWTNKKFRVFGMTLRLDGGVDLSLVEYEGTVFSWAVSAETVPPTDTSITNSFFIGPPTNLVAASGTDILLLEGDGTVISRIKLTWDKPTLDTKVTGYNIYSKLSTDTFYQFPTLIPDGNITSAFVTPVKDGELYDIQVTALSALGNESAPITLQHTVIGKSAPPGDVSTLIAAQNGDVVVMRWDQVADVDLAGYEIRYGLQSTNCCWDGALVLTSVTRGTNVTTADIPSGAWNIFIKAVDTSGNYSVSAAQTAITVTTSYDIVEYRPQEPVWNSLDHPDNVIWTDFDRFMLVSGTGVRASSTAETPNNDQFDAFTLSDTSATIRSQWQYTANNGDGYAHGQQWLGAVMIKKKASYTPTVTVLLTYQGGVTGSYGYLVVNIVTGVVTFTGVDSTAFTIEDYGVVEVDGWWFIFITGVSSTTGTVRVGLSVYPATGLVSNTGTIDVCNPILVQDIYHVEPRRSTVCANPDNNALALTSWTTSNATVATDASATPNGEGQAYSIADNSATQYGYAYYTHSTGYVHGDVWCSSCFVKKDATKTVSLAVQIDFTGGAATSNAWVCFNMSTGVKSTSNNNATVVNYGVIDFGTWYYVFVAAYSTTTGTTAAGPSIWPTGCGAASNQQTIIVWEATLVQGIWEDPYIANLVYNKAQQALSPKSKILASKDGWNTFDSYVDTPYDACRYQARQINIGQDGSVRAYAWPSARVAPGQTLPIGSVDVYFDYRLTAGSYDGWELWSAATVGLRYGKFKLEPTLTAGLPVIEGWEPTLDQVERVETGTNVIAVGGTTVSYVNPFFNPPFVTMEVVGTVALYPVFTAQPTATGFTVKIYNSAGTDVGGTINWSATGI